jgi:hypothetical protein
MKTSFKIAIAALTIASFAFNGCKKGEDDPFLSLHSRTSRMAGDWKVTQGSGTEVDVFGITHNWTYDGTTLTTTTTSPASSTVELVTMTYSFAKDGSYKTVTTTTSTSPSNVHTDSETGAWNFTGKVGGDKNKDHVMMRTLTSSVSDTNPASASTTTYTGDDGPVNVMYIDELKNKEIIFKYTGTTTPGGTSDSGQWTLTPQ